MTTENLNLEAVQQMADITQTYTTAIAVVGVFMVIILAAFAASMWEEKADRKLEREERDAERKSRERLNEVRIKREDENTLYWREAIAKMTDAVSASNALGYRIESTLQKTHDVHDDLNVQVMKIMEEISNLRLEISQRDTSISTDSEKMILMLERMESALGKILTERISENE